MSKYVKYESRVIDTSLLSVFDITDEGKVVTADKWTELWGLVFDRLNSLNTYCVSIDTLVIDWIDTQVSLQKVVDEFNTKYTALSSSFVHYGETEPTNKHIRFWVKPIEDDQTSEYTTRTDVDLQITDRLKQWNVARTASITLPVTGWSNTAPYSQVVNLSGITTNSKIDLTPTPQQLNELYNQGCTFVVENKNKIITVYCIGNTPPSDFTIPITITEVDV